MTFRRSRAIRTRVFAVSAALVASSIWLNRPVVDLAPTADGKGYWMLGADGGVFTFGNARFLGSSGGSFGGSMVGLVPELLF